MLAQCSLENKTKKETEICPEQNAKLGAGVEVFLFLIIVFVS